jgi:hypothetical protein
MLFGAAAIVVGSVMPWAERDFNDVGLVGSVSGLEGDGALTIGAGIAIGVLALCSIAGPRVRALSIVALLLAMATALIAILNEVWISAGDKTILHPGPWTGGVSPSWGIPVVIAGAAVAVLGSVLNLSRKEAHTMGDHRADNVQEV